MNEKLPLPEPITINAVYEYNLNYIDITNDISLFEVSDSNYFITLSNSNTVDVILPNIIPGVSRSFIIYKNFATNIITLSPQNGDTIDNELVFQLNSLGERVILTSAFNNWVIR